jgi:AcrR family transcriptional regulator
MGVRRSLVVVAKSVTKPRRPRKIAAKPVQQRLVEALATLTDPSVPSPHRPTIATLCRLAGVSRNTLYRYYPDIAERVRRVRRRHGGGRSAREHVIKGLRSEVAELRGQLAKLATLADHYFAAAEEQRALVAHRDRELAALKRESSPTPLRRAALAGNP